MGVYVEHFQCICSPVQNSRLFSFYGVDRTFVFSRCFNWMHSLVVLLLLLRHCVVNRSKLILIRFDYAFFPG